MKQNEPIIVEQLLNASIEQVWEALTNVVHMRKWYFHIIPDFEPKVGFKTQFLVSSGKRNFTHHWSVTEVVPNLKICYHWTFNEYPGESISTFEISKKDEQTLLKVKSEIITDFPTDIPEFKRESGAAGWEYLIKEGLPKFIEKSIKF